ncbi:MAG: S1C family serine protease [Anaerolineae bacterium]
MNRRTAAVVGIGCLVLVVLLVVLALGASYLPRLLGPTAQPEVVQLTPERSTPVPGAVETQTVIPTLTPGPAMALPAETPGATGSGDLLVGQSGTLTAAYAQLNPGVVNIQVIVQQQGSIGEAAGSGFILDQDGHIITNNHVVAGATQVTVNFFDGLQVPAEIVGTDVDSDLAVLRVEQLPEGAHPLPLGDSSAVQVGEWVLAIGNPFALGSSMSVGIVSALGRTIEGDQTPFAIPEAIQTDAAINPGNSGGPLLNMRGEVIGVNAMIATSSGSSSGVGFAIPSNVVRRVAPVLIETGSFQWAWLGVSGGSLNLAIAEANGLDTQFGAYIDEVTAGGPAAEAGLQGSRSVANVGGISVPVGGDVIVAANGDEVRDFNDLLVAISSRDPGEDMQLTILRDGEETQVTVTLVERPSSLQPG